MLHSGRLIEGSAFYGKGMIGHAHRAGWMWPLILPLYHESFLGSVTFNVTKLADIFKVHLGLGFKIQKKAAYYYLPYEAEYLQGVDLKLLGYDGIDWGLSGIHIMPSAASCIFGSWSNFRRSAFTSEQTRSGGALTAAPRLYRCTGRSVDLMMTPVLRL